MTTFSFSAEYAERYGLEEAVMIQNFEYWISKNAANGKHLHDGRFWTYNTAEAFVKLFPFWSAPQIRRILKSLEDKGVLLSGEYNDSAYDRTKWYAFTDDFISRSQLDLTKSSPRSDGSENPIPNNYQNTNIPSSSNEDSGIAHTREETLFDTCQTKKEAPTPKAPSPKKEFGDRDFIEGLMRAGVTGQTARDWVKQRSKSGAVSSRTSLNLVLKQFSLLPDTPPEELIEMAIEKSWRGFKAEWYTNAIKKNDANNKSNSDLYDRIHETGEGRHYFSTL